MNRMGVERLDCDALAMLVVPLESSQPDRDRACWHTWDASPGAEPQGLPEGLGPDSGWVTPFKHLPGDDALPYFNPHIERLLFPTGSQGGARWVCCPEDLIIELGMRDGGRRRTRVDLLERVTTPLEPARTFGLIHLSLLPKEAPDEDPGTLWWRKAIASPFRQTDVSELTLVDGDGIIDLRNGRPVRALTEALFGDPDPYLERGLYTVLLARHLPEGDDPSNVAGWRWALASPFAAASSSDDSNGGPRRELLAGGATGLMRGNAAAFTLAERKKISKSYARSFRSYWGESIVFGLMQQDCLEQFQHRLAEIRDLRDVSVEETYRDWLEFRNVLWWSHLSSSPIPQRLLPALREELGTERFFTDLEGDLATYSEYQHQCAEDRQETALANLQIYGAPFIVFAALVTAIGLFDFTDRQLVTLVGASLLVAIVASLFVRLKLKGGFKPRERLKRIQESLERTRKRLRRK